MKSINYKKQMRMKKIFTCILFTVVSLFLTTPVFAQQQLSDKDKATIAKVVVPAMIEQVSQISGLDFERLQNPNINFIINSPLFGKQSTLRAGATPISIQPDSALLNLSSIEIEGSLSSILQSALSSVKLTFAEYESFSITTNTGRTVEVNLPLKTTASMTVLGFMPINIHLNIALGEEKTGLLPFGSLSANLDLGSLESIVGVLGFKGGELLVLNESGSNGIYTYDITIGKTLRSLMDMDENAPNYKVTVDLASMGADVPVTQIALQAITDKASLTTDEVSIYFNAKALASSKMVTDSIISVEYDFANNVTTKDYSKMVLESKSGADENTVEMLNIAYDKATENAEWEWSGAEKYIIKGNQEIDPNNLISSVLSSIVADLKNVKADSESSLSVECYSLADKDDAEGNFVMGLDVTPEIVDMQTIKLVVNMQTIDGDAEENSEIEITLPLKDETISIAFIEEGATSPIATLYLKSNLMGIVTSNETIKDNVQDVKIIRSNGDILVKNGKGNYIIVNMLGQVVAAGKITSEEQFINTPNIPKGIYMISIYDGAKRKTVKFIR